MNEALFNSDIETMHRMGTLIDQEALDEKAATCTRSIRVGCFAHHRLFFKPLPDGKWVWADPFHKWAPRRPNKDGWIKVETAMAYNVKTGRYRPRRGVFA